MWLPFPPDELGDLPDGLRYEHVDADGDLPDSGDEVELYVLPYRFRPADGEVLAQLPKLKVVQTMSAGVEHIAALRARRGDALQRPRHPRHLHGRAHADPDPGEPARDPRVRARPGRRPQWQPVTRESLADKQVLIVGYGQIGEAIEARLLPFEARVTRVARSARDGVHAIDELPDLLPEADVVVLIVPGTEETKGLFDAEMLGAPQGRGAAGEHRARSGRRHRRAARRADQRSASTRRSTSSTRSRCRRTTRCGRRPTCCSCRTSAATAPRWSRVPTNWFASSSTALLRGSHSRTW